TTAPGPVHLLELCEQKLLEFVCNVDNKDMVWLEEIEEEAERMFTREFSKEPELMPKTPSQKNRRKKRRVSSFQDENRDPVRKRLSRRKTRSSQLSSRCLRSKDKVEKLATVVGENGSILRRLTRAAAAAAAAATAASAASSPTPESPTTLTKKPKNSPAQCQLVPLVEIGVGERQSAEQYLTQAPASQGILTSDEELIPKKPEAGRLESVTVSSLMATPQGPKGQGVGAGRSASKLRIAQASSVPHDVPSSPDSPWQERVLAPILSDNFSTPTGSQANPRHSLIAPGPQASLANKYSVVAKQENTVRRSNRKIANKATKEPAVSTRIICESGLSSGWGCCGWSLLPHSAASDPSSGPLPQWEQVTSCGRKRARKEAPNHGGSEQKEPSLEAEPVEATEPEASQWRKRSYKQAVSELDEEQHLEDEELQPPRSKTPSPPCPASKVVRPLRTFLHTVQKNQMLMTPTSVSRSNVMKSFIKRNTPLRVDPKVRE
uniref:Inner centromere protein n=1 Tax=Loxodonta africana TaxID=9785 RepID=G3TZ65_LOXAF